VSDGEKQGVREKIDRMTGDVLKRVPSMDHSRAREIAKRAAVAHEHNQGRRDPNRNRR
jgi:hypothetical protein